jgi:hypothetical protein
MHAWRWYVGLFGSLQETSARRFDTQYSEAAVKINLYREL